MLPGDWFILAAPPDVCPLIDVCVCVCSGGDAWQIPHRLGCFCCSFLSFSFTSFYSLPALSTSAFSLSVPPDPPLISTSLSLVLSFSSAVLSLGLLAAESTYPPPNL